MIKKKGGGKKNTIPKSKNFPSKNEKKEEVFRTEFTIIHTKLTYKVKIFRPKKFPRIETYNRKSFHNILCKKCCRIQLGLSCKKTV